MDHRSNDEHPGPERVNAATASRTGHVQTWATVVATLLAGAAFVVASLSLKAQVAALEDQRRERVAADAAAALQAQQTYAIRIKWWTEGRVSTLGGEPLLVEGASIVVQNYSAAPLENAYIRATEEHDDRTFPISIGHINPCTRMVTTWDSEHLYHRDPAGNIELRALVFVDPIGAWTLDYRFQLTRFDVSSMANEIAARYEMKWTPVETPCAA